ncbi:MAG: zinc-binding dehydrogenase [Caldithrix sp.]|nr:zinc-binding dehydrogenase [Caldithrix sp.]
MKAIRIHEHGNREKLTIDELSIPAIQAEEVLIRVKAAALNHLDIWVRKGIPGISLPLIMGSDAAGVVEKVGSSVQALGKWKQGDEVIIAPIRSCGQCEYCLAGQENLCDAFKLPGEQTDGMQAEYVSVPQRFVFQKPENLDWSQAAAFPLVAMTAYHMLVRKITLKPNQWILVYGATSGVGSIAIQIAKDFGSRVITTVSDTDKAQIASKLGADFIINYKQEPIGKTVKKITGGRGVDIVFEHTGSQTWPDTLRSLRKSGKIVTCGATTGPHVRIDLRAIFIKHQQLIGSTMGTLADLSDILQWIALEKLRPLVDRSFDVKEVQAAHRYLEEGRHKGKVILNF